MDSYKNNKINKQTYIYLMCAHCGTVCFALTRFSHTQAAIKYSRHVLVRFTSVLPLKMGQANESKNTWIF